MASRSALSEFGTRHCDTSGRERLLWVAASAALAVTAALVPGIDNRPWVVGVLAASAALNLVWHRVLPRMLNEHTRPVLVGLVAVGVALLSASLWIPAVVVHAAALAVACRDRPPVAFLVLHACLLGGLAAAGAVHDVAYWPAATIALTVVAAVRFLVDRTWIDRLIADRAELLRSRDQLLLESVTDPVTGLANRRALIDQLSTRLRMAGTTPTGLILMDLDRFKHINDTLGHAVGDRALKLIGERLVVAAQPYRMCRLGGDEFAVVVDDPAHIPELVDAAATACEPPIELGPIRLSIGVSMGSAIAPENGSTASKLMRSADLAMYHAKRQGLRHVPFGNELATMSVEELHLSARVAAALQRDEFELWYQPKVDLETGTIVGVEGLARWRHPERGLLRPGAFIRLVTLSHSHQAFTDAVVHACAAMASSLAEAGYDMPVSFNLPMHEFLRHDLVSRLETILARYDVAASQITIEVTEDTIMDDDRAVIGTVRALAEAGFCLSIDDFGTGYSSFERLLDLPVRELKIDRRFVIAAVGQPRERAVVESIVDLAERLKLDVVAEGVETTKERALMRSIGCTTAQGYHWCRPMPGPELLDLVVGNAAKLDPAL